MVRTDITIAFCCLAFIGVLLVTAYWDPSIRLLHALEMIPYAVAAILCLRGSKIGYALAAVGGGFWLWMAGFLTTFIRNGLERVAMLVRTGHVDRLDILIAAPAATFALGMVIFSVVGYAKAPGKSLRDWGV